ncbi:MAG TPA: AMP-binding protein [Acidimicrobiales bacterium]|nr:AMP-binding protein [Acidimicrobiales bacterium]
MPSVPDLHRPAGPRTTPFGTQLAELIWVRSLTGTDHPFVEHIRTGRSVTFGALRRATSRWALLLEDLGVGLGDTVGIAVSDPVDFAMVFLGTMAAGRVAAPLDPSAPDAELEIVCGRVRPAVVLSDRPVPGGTGFDWVVLRPGSFELPDPDPSTAPALPPALGASAGSGWVAAARPGAGGLVLSTSGTTGAPKLIRLDERQLLHTAGSIAGHHHLSVADRGFSPLPLFHINGEVVGLLAALVAGSTLVLDDKFHRTRFWELMAAHRITWVNAVPAIIARLAPLRDGETVPADVRFVRSASAPLSAVTLQRFEDATGLPVIETYGMTEAGSQITANPLHGPRKPGSVGMPVGVDLRVVGDRVQIRGPGVITAYAGHGYEDRVDPDGWLDTGDLGHLDDDGYLFLVGRADDVINRGGEKILPREVEDVILADPDVRAVVVVGWDHQVLGRVPVAFLVAEGVAGDGDRQRAEAIVGRLQDRCASDLSRPKRPVAFHVVERLPAGTNGKIRRSQVGQDAAIYSLLVS